MMVVDLIYYWIKWPNIAFLPDEMRPDIWHLIFDSVYFHLKRDEVKFLTVRLYVNHTGDWERMKEDT